MCHYYGMPPEADTVVVDQPQALHELAAALRGAQWIAVDTEFMREKTYYAELCLIQVATPTVVACVDPLALDDLSPLYDYLCDPDITKVFHAAEQDVALLRQHGGRPPIPIFDCQLAAALTGYAAGMSYARLVAAELGITLDKAHTRADWQRRPLPADALQYAADDVRYLARLYPALRGKLAELGRSDWLAEDFALVADETRLTVEPEKAWQRVKGTSRLRPRQQTVLAAIAAWREREAMRANRPRRWIVKDEPMLELARRQPASTQQLCNIRGLPAKLVEHHGDALIDAINCGKAAPQQTLVAAGHEPTAGEQALVDLLMACLRQLGAIHDISPASLGSRRELTRLAQGERDLPILRGWRRRIAGQPLLDVAAGKIVVRAGDGHILIQPTEQ